MFGIAATTEFMKVPIVLERTHENGIVAGAGIVRINLDNHRIRSQLVRGSRKPQLLCVATPESGVVVRVAVERIVVIVQVRNLGDPELLHVTGAKHYFGGAFCLVQRWKQHGREDCYDSNDDEQFDQSEFFTLALLHGGWGYLFDSQKDGKLTD